MVPGAPESWAAGPGHAIQVSDAFFALPGPVAQIRRLIFLLASVTPGISAALVPQYVDAADAIRAHRGLVHESLESRRSTVSERIRLAERGRDGSVTVA